MSAIVAKMTRFFVTGLLFFLPRQNKTRIERWLRGREEYRKLKRADLVVVSFGKSGRTWLRVMLSRFYQVKYGLAKRHLIGFDNLHNKNPAIPKLFFTHDNYIKDYTGNGDSKTDFYGKKVILLVRHPLDVAVSQYFQWKFRMRPGKKIINNYPIHGSDISIHDFVTASSAGLDSIIDYLNLWASERDSVKDLLIIHYEDMHQDPVKVLAQIFDFTGTSGSDEQIQEAIRFASVGNMRKMEQQRTFWLSGNRLVAKDRSNSDSYKVRKAKVSGYRDYFDADQIQAMKRDIAERLDPIYAYQA